MLRTLLLACALAVPAAPAFAQDLPASPLGLEIRADNGEAVGRVEAVVRNRDGRVVGVDASLEEPADAPATTGDLIARNQGDAYSQLAQLRDAHRTELTAARYEDSRRLR